jgi:hypothetical protein
MKKIIVISFAIFFLSKSYACDICGCGAGGNYIGILPEFHKHIFGLRYRSNSLNTHVGLNGMNTYLTSNEIYRTTEMWGGWNIGKKYRIMAAIPYSFNEKTNQGKSETKNGWGDIYVNGFYQILNNRHPVLSDKLLVQTLWIGAGLKIPTGKYTPADKGNLNQKTNLFQLGTGSVDFSINAMYDIRLQDAGINFSASYKMNTTNKYEYYYGNKLNTTAQAYYKIRIKNMFTVAPNIGFIYEQSKKDIDNNILVDISGGKLLAGSIGMEVSGNRISVGGSWQAPLSQNLANGIVKANNRMMVHISFLL